ncbi:hypothetical protein AGMMS49546_06570 [Spirochaetia bacterium]|nr:hypothetical protein AGMMS49546_06570 [Spirochaetia bacterium]
MKLHKDTDRAAYTKVEDALKRRRKGVTVADVVAATALPLNTVKELVPRAADEYSARLEVTESGEILYSFPQGFTSRYRGFRAGLKRFTQKCIKGLGIFASWFFKVWIMVMLVGYFVIFMLIALAALMLSVAANSSSSNNRSRGDGLGGMYLVSGIFNFIIRIWFYSELTKSMDRRYGDPWNSRQAGRSRPKGRPLYKAIFSFVFGETDPNREAGTAEKKAVIAYIQANQGVISLPEYMAITGLPPAEAEAGIMACCSEFGGSPEVTGDGTILYRFDELLKGQDKTDRSFDGASAPLRKLKKFSANEKKMNGWFGIINSVNLLFGGYFLYQSSAVRIAADAATGRLLIQADAAYSYLYKVTYMLLTAFTENPLPILTVGLGMVPLIFSLLFWIIPALRFSREKNENEETKLSNLRKTGFQKIWSKIRGIQNRDIDSAIPECRPKKLTAAQDKIIKEMGTYSMPEVEVNEEGATLYSFNDLEREKTALAQYRSAINPDASDLGKIVFDTDR